MSHATNEMTCKNVILFSVLISILCLWTSAIAVDLFRGYDLEFEGEELARVHCEDLNNDNLKDILIFIKRGDPDDPNERWVSVYLQGANGFASNPVQTFELPNNLILLDLGDVQGDARKEFVYVTDEGFSYFVLGENGFILKPKKLLDVQSMFMLSDRESIRTWDFVSDINNDGFEDIFIPQITTCQIYYGVKGQATWNIQTIPMRMQPKVYAHYSERYSVGHKADALYSTPYVFYDDFNQDDRDDLVGVYDDSLVVFYQNSDGLITPERHDQVALNHGEIWRGAKIQRTHLGDESVRTFLMRIIDLNGDGVLDIVGTWVSTKESFVNPETEVRLYFGKRDTSDSGSAIYFEEEPDHIVEPNGTMMVLDVLDLNKDGLKDLIIPVVNVGLRNIIKMLLTKRVELEAEVYLMNPDGSYSEDPNAEPQIVLPFTFQGGAVSPVYEIADFNGDGYFDIVSSLEEKWLIFFWGSEKEIISSSLNAKHGVLLPRDGELVTTQELNGDAKNDLIITYNKEEAKTKNAQNIVRILIAN